MPVILLRRPPDWEEHEKPALPGSPAMPHHEAWVRLCYGLIAVLLALTGGLSGIVRYFFDNPDHQKQREC